MNIKKSEGHYDDLNVDNNIPDFLAFSGISFSMIPEYPILYPKTHWILLNLLGRFWTIR